MKPLLVVTVLALLVVAISAKRDTSLVIHECSYDAALDHVMNGVIMGKFRLTHDRHHLHRYEGLILSFHHTHSWDQVNFIFDRNVVDGSVLGLTGNYIFESEWEKYIEERGDRVQMLTTHPISLQNLKKIVINVHHFKYHLSENEIKMMVDVLHDYMRNKHKHTVPIEVVGGPKPRCPVPSDSPIAWICE